MAEELPDTLQQAENALHEGRLETARLILIEYLRRVPSSERAWWLLSFVVPEGKQQIDCLTRVLRLNPGHAEAARRLELLKAPSASSPARPAVNPFVSGEPEPEPAAPQPVPQAAASLMSAAVSAPSPAEPEIPVAEPPAQKPVPPKKKYRWIVDALVIGFVLCLVLGAAGYVGYTRYLERQEIYFSQTQAMAQALTQAPLQTLPPTWTPTGTNTLIPTRTQTPSATPTETPTITLTSQFTLTYTPLPPGAVVGPGYTEFAPDFRLQTYDRQGYVSLSEYIGRPILVVFWATWCPYCREEMAALQDIADRYADEGLVIVAVNAEESPVTVQAFVQARNLDFIVLLDSDGSVGKLYGVEAIPRNFFINPLGRIMALGEGGMTYEQIEARVIPLMIGYTPPTP